MVLHNLKEFVITYVPSVGGLSIALDMTNLVYKTLFAIGSLVYLWYRIKLVRKEYESKTKTNEQDNRNI